MSLRQQLKRSVAGFPPLPMQHATSEASYATGSATDAQHQAANPHKCWVSGATGNATTVQQDGCMDATQGQKLHVAFATPCNTQLGLTAQRQVRELIEAALRACDHHGDNEAEREQMRQDVQNTPPHLRPDLLDHFDSAYRKDTP